MNNPIVIILVVIGVLTAIYFTLIKPRLAKKPIPSLSAPGITLPPTDIGHYRPDGGMYYTSLVINEPLHTIIGQTIVDGLTDMLAAEQYAHPLWTNKMTTKDYKVFFIAPMATNQDGSPALLVGGVQSAGTTINTNPQFPGTDPEIVLPEQAQWNYLEYLKESVHNEGEHACEFNNDINVFLSFTGPNDVHPHFPAPPATLLAA